jgi:hypothetical protein
MNLVQAGGKPVKWTAAVLNTSQNLQAYPLGKVYVGGEDGVSITNGISWCGSGSIKNYYSYISFEIALPSQILLYLDPADFYESGFESDPTIYKCGFPTSGGGVWPYCLADFLNSPQPYMGYRNVKFNFLTPACEGRTSTDFTQMEIGQSLKLYLSFGIAGQNFSDECSECIPENYHNIWGKAHGFISSSSGLPDIYITRDSQNEWTVTVDTYFNNPDYQNSQYVNGNDQIIEHYCVCVRKTGKGGRITYEKEIKYPAWTKTHLGFQIKFTKSQ